MLGCEEVMMLAMHTETDPETGEQANWREEPALYTLTEIA